MAIYKHGLRTGHVQGFQVKTTAWDAVAPALARSGSDNALASMQLGYPTLKQLESYVNADHKPTGELDIALPDDDRGGAARLARRRGRVGRTAAGPDDRACGEVPRAGRDPRATTRRPPARCCGRGRSSSC